MFSSALVSLLAGLRKHHSTDSRRCSVRRRSNETLSFREQNRDIRHYGRSPQNLSIFHRPVETNDEAAGWQVPLKHKVKKNTFLYFHLSPNLLHNRLCPNDLSPKRPHSRLSFKLAVIRLLLLLLLLTIHEDASVGSRATPTVPVEDGFGWTMLCAMATKVTLNPVITVRGSFTTVVTVKMSPSRVWQVWSLFLQLKYDRAQTVLLF